MLQKQGLRPAQPASEQTRPTAALLPAKVALATATGTIGEDTLNERLEA
jgi:hypothetical protein